jgi:hypothetical protein
LNRRESKRRLDRPLARTVGIKWTGLATWEGDSFAKDTAPQNWASRKKMEKLVTIITAGERAIGEGLAVDGGMVRPTNHQEKVDEHGQRPAEPD